MGSKFELFINNKYYENTKERMTYGETPFKNADDYFRASQCRDATFTRPCCQKICQRSFKEVEYYDGLL